MLMELMLSSINFFQLPCRQIELIRIFFFMCDQKQCDVKNGTGVKDRANNGNNSHVAVTLVCSDTLTLRG